MNCARAFGACVSLRDEPGGGDKIPEQFSQSDFNKIELEKYQAELVRYQQMDLEEAEKLLNEEWEKKEAYRLLSLEENNQQQEAYAAMLKQVEQWTPPTDDHIGLHEFMKQQIEESIKFDDITTYFSEPINKLSAQEWLNAKIDQVERNMAYRAKAYAEEVERTNKRNQWIQALRSSLL